MTIAAAAIWIAVASLPASAQPAARSAGPTSGSIATIVRPALEKAAALRAAGQNQEALDLLRVATREVKLADGETSPNLLPIYEIAAAILVETAQPDKATVLLVRAMEMHRGLLAENRHPDPACFGRTLLVEHRHQMSERRIELAHAAAREACLVLDAHAGHASADTVQAAAALASSLTALEEMLGPDHEASLAATASAAEAHEATGRLEAAIALRRQLAGRAAKRHGPTAAVARAHADRVVRLLRASGRAGEALELHQPAIRAADQAGVAAARRLQGDLLLSLERFTDAEAAYRAALEADLAAFDEPHPAIALDRLSIERIAAVRGRKIRDQVLESCLAALERPADEKAEPAVAAIEALLVASDIHAHRGDDERARECGRRAARAAAELEAAAADLRVAAQVAAARTSAAAPKTAARDALEQALKTADGELGCGHPAAHLAAIAVAEAALGAGDVETALGLVTRMLDRPMPRSDPSFEERIVEVVDRTATAADGGRPVLRERLVAVRESQFGSDHLHTGQVLALLAGTRLAAGDAESATTYGRRAVEILSRTLPADHPEVAGARLVLAEALRASGRLAEAGPLFEQAQASWESAAGADHPLTRVAMRGLVRTLLATGDHAAALPHLERLRTSAAAKSANGIDAREAIAHMRLLVRLGGILAESGQRDRARQVVVESLALACWQPGPFAEAEVVETLALSMAEIAWIFKAIEEPASSTEAVRRARSYATQLPSVKETLARIDATVARQNLERGDL